jgi:tetratricopeptide (TPR) repeat protein
MTDRQPGEGGIPERFRRLLPRVTALLLVLAVAAVYGRTAGFPFLAFDDELYVTGNGHVLSGLTADGVAWAFRSTHAANWHPLTWISHMADVSLFGAVPGPPHAENVLLHALNSLLLYFLLRRLLPGREGQAAFVAALFAVHPLHVESVAWVAERKDLLCALFSLLSVGAWISWTEKGGAGRYAAAALLFALALLAKPMAVSLPLLLLLLDFWPLRRERGVWRLLAEKVPLFLLSAVSSAATLFAQGAGGAVQSGEVIPLPFRLANAALSLAGYAGKFLFPVRLAAYYPHRLQAWQAVPLGETALAVLLLAAATAAALFLRRRRPWILAGWGWFVVSLLPVIGIVQAGGQAMADRYMYLPMVGLALVAAGAGGELAERRPRLLPALAALSASALLLLAVLAFRQAGYWRDDVALFSHATEVTEGNWKAHQVLGDVLQKRGREGEAISHYREVLRIMPFAHAANFNLGVLLLRQGNPVEARDRLLVYRMVEPGDPMGAFWLSAAEEEIRKGGGAAASGGGR